VIRLSNCPLVVAITLVTWTNVAFKSLIIWGHLTSLPHQDCWVNRAYTSDFNLNL
jgi:hypothetical protein